MGHCTDPLVGVAKSKAAWHTHGKATLAFRALTSLEATGPPPGHASMGRGAWGYVQDAPGSNSGASRTQIERPCAFDHTLQQITFGSGVNMSLYPLCQVLAG